MRILVTGANGRLGSTLMHKLAAASDAAGVAGLADDPDVIGRDLPELDVADFADVRRTMIDVRPDLVIHTAAWTDVDGCAREPEKALAINGFGAQNVAVAAAQVDAAIVYISSNEVFDGTLNRPYTEYDTRHAVNPYGYSKLIGERGVAEVNQKHYIVRTAWLFAHGGHNFIHSILNAAELGRDLRVVTDEVANPTYNEDLAEALLALIATRRYGRYHLVNEGAVSRYNFARYVLDRAGLGDVPIQPISSREWPRASTPPTYAAMSNQAARTLGITLRGWQAAVDAFLQKEGRFG